MVCNDQHLASLLYEIERTDRRQVRCGVFPRLRDDQRALGIRVRIAYAQARVPHLLVVVVEALRRAVQVQIGHVDVVHAAGNYVYRRKDIVHVAYDRSAMRCNWPLHSLARRQEPHAGTGAVYEERIKI